MVCSSADQFAENLLESSGADAKRSRLEGRNGVLMWKWTLEHLDHLCLHVETKEHQQQKQRQQQQQLHQTLRYNLTVMNPKHSGSELSCLKSAELLDARHARIPVWGSHTLVNAEPSKKCGRRADELQRRRNAELLPIQLHDHWTRVRVRRIQSRRGRNRLPWQTQKTRQTRWMWTIFKGHPQPLIRWNLMLMKMCRRKHEWQETFFTSVARTN